jgi:hypothetical protein
MKIRMVIDAVFELLTDDRDRTDSREGSNYPQLIDIGEIREDSQNAICIETTSLNF